MSFEVIHPVTTEALLAAIKNLKNKPFRFAAGCTDLLPELRKNPVKNLTVINVAQVRNPDFSECKKTAHGLQVGASVTAHHIATTEDFIRDFPVLQEAAWNLASTQIRQVATIGGNVCTASPSGDMACALMALNATCEIMNEKGEKRTVPVTEFFTGVRKTALQKNELLYTISIPANCQNAAKIFSHFIKIGSRKSMECSVVSLAYHIQTDKAGIITQAGVAIGAVAPTIRFTESACASIKGKNMYTLTGDDRKAFAENVLHYASPISDLRASAWYRREVLYNISKALFEDLDSPDQV